MSALDHFLDLVLAPETRKPLLNLFQGVGTADGFDGFFLGMLLAIATNGVRSRSFGCERTFSRSRGLLAFGDCFEKRRTGLGRRRKFFASRTLCGFVSPFFNAELWRCRFEFRLLLFRRDFLSILRGSLDVLANRGS